MDRAHSCSCLSLALDESADICDVAQLGILNEEVIIILISLRKLLALSHCMKKLECQTNMRK